MRRAVALGAATVAFTGWAAADPVAPSVAPSRVPAERAQAPAARSEALELVTGVRARVLHRAPLRARPGKRIVRQLERRTRFRSRTILTVVARRGVWLGVLHEDMPNGRAGWVHERHVRLLPAPMTIEVDRSERRAVVRRDGQVVKSFRVGVGRPSSPTPLGRFGITDRLIAGSGLPYGCCILALSGRQPNLPQGWPGGDRLAFHGTPGDRVGGAQSAGCLHVRNRDLRRLLRLVTAGTRVDVVP
jgi:lipoprotein-anchoring transpeptidase ErfK/SrfK